MLVMAPDFDSIRNNVYAYSVERAAVRFHGMATNLSNTSAGAEPWRRRDKM
jgi:hypothetical protein